MDFYKVILNTLFKLDKKKTYIIFFLIMIGTALEILSIGSIIPLISFISNPENFNFVLIKNINIFEGKTFLILILIVFFVYLFKSIFLILINYKQNIFAWNLYEKISNLIYSNYINKKYSFHLKHHSSELTRNIKDEIKKFVSGAVIPLLNLIIEFITLFSIFILLAIYNFKVTIFASSTLLIFVGLFILITKKPILNFGMKKQTFDQVILKKLSETFQSIREIKIIKLQDLMINSFKKEVQNISITLAKYDTLKNSPKYLLELVIIILLMGFFLIGNSEKSNTDELFASITLFAVAALRLIPSFTRIINHIQTIKFNTPSCQVIIKELNSPMINLSSLEKVSEIKFLKQVKLNNIFFKYNFEKNGRNDQFVLNNLNFMLNKGEIIGISGDSGSGKSTLLDIFTGLLKPIKGSIDVDEISIQKDEQLLSWQNNISYVHQNSAFFNDTIKNNITLFQGKFDQKYYEKIIDCVCLKEFINNLANKDDSELGEKAINISGGEKQRIALARAIYMNKDILILDEATNALDEEMEKKVINNILNLIKNKNVIIVSHNSKILNNCDKIYEINNGTMNLSGKS